MTHLSAHRALATGALALASLSMSGMANAVVVDFETKPAFSCEFANQSDNGLTFSHGFAACYYSPTNPADFPTAPPSTVMGIGFSAITVARDDASVFDLLSVDLAFGPFNHNGVLSDTTLVTGFLFGGGTVSTVLTIDYSFDTYMLDWTGLTHVIFGQLGESEYLAFDNLVYDAAAVDEPAVLALAGLGLLGLGATGRRRSR